MIHAPSFLQLDTKSRGYAYFGTAPPPGVRSFGGAESKLCHLEIHNAREHPKPFQLDEASFELVGCPTSLSTQDFYKIGQGDRELTEKYHNEVSEFVTAKLGCDKIVCFHSQVRNAQRAGEAGNNIQPYALGGPHTDSSALSGDELALSTLTKEGDKPSSYKRYLYLNLWRNISEDPIEDHPLALMDERTAVKPDDYLPRDLFMQDHRIVQYGLNARHADQHKWYYYPQMTKSEGILFKQIDSDWTKSGRTCFHMAVRDPNAPQNAKPRESIEFRMICYFKEADVNSMPTPETTSTSTTAEVAPSGLHSASTLQLIGDLLSRIPIFGRFYSAIFSNPILTMIVDMMATTHGNPPYSGNPEDYVERVMNVVVAYPMWPSFARSMVEKQLKGKPEMEGMESFTTMIVGDSTNHLKTKQFSSDEKKAVVKACLANEKFVEEVQKQVGKLFL